MSPYSVHEIVAPKSISKAMSISSVGIHRGPSIVFNLEIKYWEVKQNKSAYIEPCIANVDRGILVAILRKVQEVV